jgi:signal peptidase I
MSGILIIALALLFLAPVGALFIQAGWMYLATKWFKVASMRFWPVVRIALVLSVLDLLLLAAHHFGGLTSRWWSLVEFGILFFAFFALIYRHQRLTPWRALGIYATTSALTVVTLAVGVVTIIVPVRFLVASPFEVKGESMEPTYIPNDLILVDKLAYRSRSPARGDVVVIVRPDNPGTYSIERIVGLPNEQVLIANGIVTIDGGDTRSVALSEPYLLKQSSTEAVTDKPVLIPADSYFVLGDNREHSNDSRYWGTLPRDHIVGIVAAKIWPPR